MLYTDVPAMKAYIEAQGSLLSLRVMGYKSQSVGHNHKRGIIRVFSQASRRRLMRFMARLKTRKIRATFITLTFSGKVEHVFAKKVLKRFAMRFRRRFPKASAVWRLEYQERGAIHFHLLCFNLPFWKQSELQKAWEDCTEEITSIVDIRMVHGARSVMAYISKYIAKKDERAEITSLDDGSYQHEGRDKLSGRFWGYINKELLPLGEVVSGVLTERLTIRSLSSFMWALIGSDNPYNSISAHLFADNARWLCERAIEEGGLYLDEYNWTRDVPQEYINNYHPYTEHFSEPELSMKNEQALGRIVKGERSELVQPLTNSWLAQSIFTLPAQKLSPYFDKSGIVV